MIYLASTSPRRKALLKKYGIKFKVIKPYYEEIDDLKIVPSKMVKQHALEKAKSCTAQVERGFILAADTIVYQDGRVIGKPKNMKEAIRILNSLQGRWHSVFTGVAVIKIDDGKSVKQFLFSEKTKVKLKVMSSQEIKKYIKKINPLDKAGAYAIQSKNQNIINRVTGSLNNAVGLPIESVLQKFKSLKIGKK